MRGWAAPAALLSTTIALGLVEKFIIWTRVPLPAPHALVPFLDAIGLLGSIEVVWAVAIAYAAYMAISRRGLPLPLLASLFVAELLDGVLKVAFSICRPLEVACKPYQVLLVDSYSYPSGHATRTFSVPLNAKGRAARALFFAYALAVSISRVGVEVHYPLDVVGGAALGIASALIVRLALPRVLRALGLASPQAGGAPPS